MKPYTAASAAAALMAAASIPLIPSKPDAAAALSLASLPASVIGESAAATLFSTVVLISESLSIKSFPYPALAASAFTAVAAVIIKSYLSLRGGGGASLKLFMRDAVLVAAVVSALAIPCLTRCESLLEPVAAVCIAGVAGFGIGVASSAIRTGHALGVPSIKGVDEFTSWISKHLIDVIIASSLAAALIRAYLIIGINLIASVITASITTYLLFKLLPKFRLGKIVLLCLTLALTAAFIRWGDVRYALRILKMINGVLQSLRW